MTNLPTRMRLRKPTLAGFLTFALFSALFTTASLNLAYGQVAPSLGNAKYFAVLGGSTVTSTGSTTINGDLGVSPGTAITGFPPGTNPRGVFHPGDGMAAKAHTDAATAYANLGNQTCNTSYGVPTDVGGMTLLPGVYCFSSSAQLTGQVRLDAGGDPNAVWVFRIGSTLTTAASSSVQLANGAQQRNVFWQVGSSATVGTATAFQGNILALASISVNTGATISGSALALNGAVTLDANTVSLCVCVGPYPAIVASVIKTITVAPALGTVAGTVYGASLSPDGKSIWVTGYNGSSDPGFVSLINVASLELTGSVAVGAGPADIAFSAPGGRALVTNYYDSSLSVVAVKTLKVSQTIDLSTIPVTQPSGLLRTGSHIFIATQGTTNDGIGNIVPEFNTTTPPSLSKVIPIPGQSGRPAVVPLGAARYAGSVLVPVFVTGKGSGTGHPALVTVSAHGTVGSRVTLWASHAAPQAVVVSPDGKYAYVSLFDSSGGPGGVWVISLETLTTKTVIQTCDPKNYGEAMSADGNYLLVAGFSENQVALIDTATDTVDAIIKGGHQPNAIALTGDNSEAFFTNQTDGTVTVVSFTPSL